MVSIVLRSAGVAPPSRVMVIGPANLGVGAHTILYVEPAATFSSFVGFEMASKPSVGSWARTALARAKIAAMEKRILATNKLTELCLTGNEGPGVNERAKSNRASEYMRKSGCGWN